MLLATVTFDTPENQRTICTTKTLVSLAEQVNFLKHPLVIVDNNSTDLNTIAMLRRWEEQPGVRVIRLPENVGTAKAINQAWKLRRPGEHALKMDNDVVVHQTDWPDDIELAFKADPTVGICGLKRKDCWEFPGHESPWLRSELFMFPHVAGERWLVGERVNHVMGTCQGYSSALLDRIGFLHQMGRLYGHDDCLAAARCHKAGFKNVFLPHIDIDHVDNVNPDFTAWKQTYAGEQQQLYNQTAQAYIAGTRDIYHGPDE